MKKLLIIIFILSLCVTFAEAQRPKVDEITAREKITTPMLKSGVDTVIKGSGVMADSIRLNGQWLKEWSLSIGSGGYASNLYPTNQISTVVGTYKKLSYTNDVAETEKSIIVNNNEVLSETYLFELPSGLTYLDAGIWFANLRFKVSSAVGITQLKFEVFKRTSGGDETTLFSKYTNEINETSYITARTETNQPQYNVLTTDRIGIRVYGKTTSSSNVTINYIIGDGNASYFGTPIALRHSQLRGMTTDSVHISVAQKKNLITGTGTQNYLTKWGANNTLTQGIAQDNGTTFLINGFLNSNNFKTNATSKSIKIGYTVNSSEEETSENYNLYLGEQAGNSITTGASNINIGYQAGYTNTTHGNNINIGSQAGYSSNIGKNIYIGDQAGYSNTTGQNNINIGLLTGYNITQGSYNTLIGNENGGTISYTSDNNTMIGYRCGVSLTSSTSGNTYIGSSVNSLGTTSGNATAIGFKSAFNGAGTSSIYFGSYAGYYITESNVLVIDNAQRTEGTKYTNPLIFGKFNASLGLQEFRINAKTFINGNLNYASNSDATDDYTASISQISSYQNGLIIYFMANIANTGACTINVNSLGAKALKMKHDQDPTDNYIEAGSIVHAIYDGTNFQMLQPAAN